MLWTVIIALAVRNSLMNAGSPIFDAFAMEHISSAERATLSAAAADADAEATLAAAVVTSESPSLVERA